MPAFHRSRARAGSPALTPPRPGSWRDSAACLGDPDPDAWFADAHEKARTGHALATCGGCPVRAQCLDFATTHGVADGIWGGLTGQERTRRTVRDGTSDPDVPERRARDAEAARRAARAGAA
jgi:WhiB family redox-sensing transcriptional regulator